MAKPKLKTLVKVYPKGGINIWTDVPERWFPEIEEIEGITSIFMISGNPIRVYVDPRYDPQEIAEEIRLLLSSEVPDVFKAGEGRVNDEI